MKKRDTHSKRPGKPVARHRHGAARCLGILRQLSAYIDDELPSQICKELRRHLGACPNCEVFVASLRHTVTLCRHCPTPSLTAADRAALRRDILRAAQIRFQR
ncbi:MAG TPA: zf-HC2 domain-containing protein [Nitrospira sp.]|nr:zf-HC2 domain-containing protein [Nitrospira sp.]